MKQKFSKKDIIKFLFITPVVPYVLIWCLLTVIGIFIKSGIEYLAFWSDEDDQKLVDHLEEKLIQSKPLLYALSTISWGILLKHIL